MPRRSTCLQDSNFDQQLAIFGAREKHVEGFRPFSASLVLIVRFLDQQAQPDRVIRRLNWTRPEIAESGHSDCTEIGFAEDTAMDCSFSRDLVR